MSLALRKAGIRDVFVARAVAVENWRECMERGAEAPPPPDMEALSRFAREDMLWLVENPYGVVAIVLAELDAKDRMRGETAPLRILMRPVWDEPSYAAESVELVKRIGRPCLGDLRPLDPSA